MTQRPYLFDTNIITGRAFEAVRRLPAGERFSCVVLSEVMTAADPKPFRAYRETWKRAATYGKLIMPHPDDWLPATRMALGVDLQELEQSRLTSHRLMLDRAGDPTAYLIHARPKLDLIPACHDHDADMLLEGAHVSRELLLK